MKNAVVIGNGIQTSLLRTLLVFSRAYSWQSPRNMDLWSVLCLSTFINYLLSLRYTILTGEGRKEHKKGPDPPCTLNYFFLVSFSGSATSRGTIKAKP